MPVLSLGQVCSMATTFAGGRMDLQLSEASLYANLALEQVVEAAGTRHGPREALAVSSTTSGGNRIALPSDFAAPIAITMYVGSTSTNTLSRTTATVPLIQKDTPFLDAQDNEFTTGQPMYYAIYNTWVELFPSPNSAYSLLQRYVARQPTLVLSTDTPALSAPWHQAWAYKTIALVEASRNNPEGEQIAEARFRSYVATIPTDLAQRQMDRRSMHLTFARRTQ